jgi:hypothetical protein
VGIGKVIALRQHDIMRAEPIKAFLHHVCFHFDHGEAPGMDEYATEASQPVAFATVDAVAGVAHYAASADHACATADGGAHAVAAAHACDADSGGAFASAARANDATPPSPLASPSHQSSVGLVFAVPHFDLLLEGRNYVGTVVVDKCLVGVYQCL